MLMVMADYELMEDPSARNGVFQVPTSKGSP